MYKVLFRRGYFILLLLFSILAEADTSTNVENLRKLPSQYNMIVALYGRPGTKTMGILGEYPIDTIFEKVKKRAKTYEEALGNTQHVTPGLEIIYEMATTHPGRDGKYVLTLPEKRVMAYINKAQAEHTVIVLDVQLGKKTPAQAIKPLLKYLKYKDVHLAIDPEFSVDDLNVRPGKKIGSITGEQINEAQKLISDYLKENHIQEDKILLIHMFTQHMVTDKKAVQYHDRVHLIMNLDGHGSPALKIKIYNGLYTEARAAKVVGGFKVFLKHDKPRMTPKQVLGLEPAGKARVKEMPKFINYQ
jgi:hypothetical protein